VFVGGQFGQRYGTHIQDGEITAATPPSCNLACL